MPKLDSLPTLTKIFYRPIDAAIRWCNLMHYENNILESAWNSSSSLSKTFPQWPCLHTNMERIIDAIRNKELPYGFFGVTAPHETAIDYRLLTIRHADLKWWMSQNYPDQHPIFLFGNQPLITEQKISIGTYLTLRADRDALETELKAKNTSLREILDDLKTAGLQRESLRNFAIATSSLSERSEISYQHIIAALIQTLLGSSPAGKPNSVFSSQAAIVDSITAHYPNIPGLSKRSLDAKFAAARRRLSRR